MYSVRNLVEALGDPILAEVELMKHFTSKRMLFHNWSRSYAEMEFIRRWAPLFRRHLRALARQVAVRVIA